MGQQRLWLFYTIFTVGAWGLWGALINSTAEAGFPGASTHGDLPQEISLRRSDQSGTGRGKMRHCKHRRGAATLNAMSGSLLALPASVLPVRPCGGPMHGFEAGIPAGDSRSR